MNNKYKILVVEDEVYIRDMLVTLLESGGYQVISALSCSNALMLTASHKPDLVILDLGLPDLDGTHYIQTVRENSLVPIIILSARANEQDKVQALDLGANDYVTKPFGAGEMLARVRSALRNSRNGSSQRHNVLFRLGDLAINFDSRQVYMAEQEVHLTQTEYNILAHLADNCGKMVSYSAIIKAVWGFADEGSTKHLQVNMVNLRRKLGLRPGDTSFISNEVGVGYRMNSDEI